MNLEKRIAALFDAAGFHDARSQALRRTFASTAAAGGYSDSIELTGHAGRGVTARHYLRPLERVLAAAADCVSARMAAALKGESQDPQSIAIDEPEKHHFAERAAKRQDLAA